MFLQIELHRTFGLGRLLLDRVIDAARRNAVRRLGGVLRRVVKDLDDELGAFVGTPASFPATEA